MIFWTSKNTQEDWSGRPMLTRWVLCGEWTFLEVHQEYREVDGDGVWNDRKNYARIDVSKKFRVGTQHFYYDGPHCSWLLGFIQISWSLEQNCKKCWP